MKEKGNEISGKISSFGLESLLWNVDTSAYTKYPNTLMYTFDEVVSFLEKDFSNFSYYKEVNGIKQLFFDNATQNVYKKFLHDLRDFYEYDNER